MEGGNFNECLVIGSVISRNVQSLWIVQFLYHQYHSNTQYNMNDGWEDHKKLLNISVGLLSAGSRRPLEKVAWGAGMFSTGKVA
jgi:hypothetical protein